MNAPGLARTYSMSIVGIEGHLVDVETYAGSGLVAFTLVGLLDTSVREARDRVRAAFESCGLDVLDQRITVNLSPAGSPSRGPPSTSLSPRRSHWRPAWYRPSHSKTP